jgi:hypothetical protein
MMKKEIEARLFVYAMSNMKSERTGLPGQIYIWISNKAGAKHGARIKVSKIRGHFSESESDTFSVTITVSPIVVAGESNFSPREMKAIFFYVKKNRLELIKFWDSTTMDYEDIKALLKPITPEELKSL